MTRIALAVEYDGSSYYGWQMQKHSDNTVQYVLEKALGMVANGPVRVVCAGRTDTGVHGAGQVVHFDTQAVREDIAWVRGTNSNLPPSVAVLWAKLVPNDFHARFSATRRRYRYVIFNRNVRPTFHAFRTSWYCRPLDEHRMQAAATDLLGQHDFNAYRAVACQAKSPVRTIHRLDVTRSGPFVYLDVEADAFLHHMIRNIAGVLMAIGCGDQEVAWAKEVLQTRDRTLGGVTAPPYGLYLMEITYPETFELPALSPTSPVW